MIYKNKINLKIEKSCIFLDQTINDALKNLSSSGFKMCIVLNRNKDFKGVINDGDIRRALLKGYDLTSKIEKIYNKKPIVIRKNSKKSKILKKLSLENVDQAPIVRNKKLIGIFSRNNFISENLNTPVVIMCGGFAKD